MMFNQTQISQCSSVQSLSHVRLFATPCIAARQVSLSITNSWSSLKLMLIESVITSSHFILLSPSVPASNASQHRVFSNESTLHMRWPKYWNFSFSISSSKEYPGLISFRMDGWISLQAKGLSGVFSNTTVQSINSSMLSFLHSGTLTSIHDHWKNHGPLLAK